jgi:dihydroorotate dehydrogenase (fumarate)
MVNLKTSYLGLELKNPIIVGASNISYDPAYVKRIEDSGASAIVFKSLFEEQIQLEMLEMEEEIEEYAERHAEMISLYPHLKHAGPKEYLMKLKKLKESVNIPVIASLNAVYKETWLEYSKLIEETGVDAIELNFFSLPEKFDRDSETIINNDIEILGEIVDQLKIPVSVKLSPYYVNPLNVVSRMEKAGSSGFVLFNRLLQPDIDIEKEVHQMPFHYSKSGDNGLSLRYAGLLYGNIDAKICCNTGIHTSADVIKMILTGADCVQVVSTVYENKPEYINVMLTEMEKWMERKGYNSLGDFQGKLSKKNLKEHFVYKRAQYVDILLENAEILKLHTLR